GGRPRRGGAGERLVPLGNRGSSHRRSAPGPRTHSLRRWRPRREPPRRESPGCSRGLQRSLGCSEAEGAPPRGTWTRLLPRSEVRASLLGEEQRSTGRRREQIPSRWAAMSGFRLLALDPPRRRQPLDPPGRGKGPPTVRVWLRRSLGRMGDLAPRDARHVSKDLAAVGPFHRKVTEGLLKLLDGRIGLGALALDPTDRLEHVSGPGRRSVPARRRFHQAQGQAEPEVLLER